MKIFCIGRNYVDHAKELNNPVPEQPVVFMKPKTALLLDNKDFYIPEFSKDVHYELEIVLRLCKNGKHVSPKYASDYYDEISLGIDFTARDIQKKCKEKGHPWELAKAFDHSAVVGEFIPFDSIEDLQNKPFELIKNGDRVQQGFAKDMIFDFNYIICYLSKHFTLNKADLIFTGTPAGVGKVEIGDNLKGNFDGRNFLNFDIK